MSSTTMKAAQAAADEGIQAAADHAERVSPGWVDEATETLRQYVRGLPSGFEHFTIEKARAAIAGKLPEPPDLRAWGQVTRAAAARGYIERTERYARAASSHGSPKPLYIRGEAA